jgi:hypothetical protein
MSLRTLNTGLILLAWSLAGLAAADAAAQPPKPDGQPPPHENSAADDSSLDQRLLDSLDDDLLEGLDIAAPRSADPQQGTDTNDSARDLGSDLDRQLLEQLGEGEDIGEEPENPFVSIGRRMRTAEELIRRRITSERTQRLQDQIVADLERLIEQLNKQCQSGQRNSSGSPKPAGKPGGQSQAGSGENQGGNRPAKESTDRVGVASTDEAEMERMRQMLKRVWGHLPPKVREQMSSGTIEEFLPKYEQLIEDYFSRLAKEERE